MSRDRVKWKLVGKVVGHLGEKTELLILSGGIQVATNLEGVFLCTDIADQIVHVSNRRVRREPVLEQEAVVARVVDIIRLEEAFEAVGRVKADRRSEERRVGKEDVSPCKSRWPPYH